MKQEHHIEKPTILVVDDQPEQLGALFAELQMNGYSLLISRNSAETFKILTRFQPDIILLDVRLPDTDGFEVCRRLKRDEELRNIPVLFMTGVSELDGKLEGFRAGGADYITKPFQLEEVLARIGTHMTVRRLQRALEEEKERFKGLSDATLEGILFHDRGRIVEVNRSLERMLGYCREEMTKRDVRDLLAPEFRSVSDELAVSEEERVFEARGQRKDGTEIALEIQNRPVRYRDRNLQVVALRDISWRKTLERETRQLASENIVLKASLSKRDRLGELVGSGPAMQKAYERLLKAAVTDAPVIVYGETGAGKELAARTIWQLSEKYSKVFVPVNCAAVQEPLFESQFFGYRKGAFTGATRDQPGFFDRAKDGTLFLDEVGELSLAMQAKLLRVLNNGEYTPVGATKSRIADVRIIAASNQPLRTMVANGKFREDLFHRLHVIAIEMPPLRRHMEDIPLLIDHFLGILDPQGATRRSLPDEIVDRFEEYDWPGNVRELVNEIQRYIAMDEVELHSPLLSEYSSEDASGPSAPEQPLHEKLLAFERKIIADALCSADGNRFKASERLRVPLPTLYRKIQKYGL